MSRIGGFAVMACLALSACSSDKSDCEVYAEVSTACATDEDLGGISRDGAKRMTRGFCMSAKVDGDESGLRAAAIKARVECAKANKDCEAYRACEAKVEAAHPP